MQLLKSYAFYNKTAHVGSKETSDEYGYQAQVI